MPDGPVAVRVTVTDAAGNSSTQTETFTLDASPANAPQVQIDKVAGDDFVNRAEANGQSGVTISGSSQNVEAGQTLTVTLYGKNYTATVNAEGRWSATVPPADLAQVPDGRQAISVTVNDVAGNSTISSHNVTFAAQPASQPTITLNPVAQDDVINALERGQPLNISGSSTSLAAGTVITVLFNDKTYTGSVNSSGNWTITVPQADMQALQETANGTPYVVSASAVDAALNPASASSSVTGDLSAPTLAVDVANSFLSDGNISIAEAAVDQTVSGTGTPGETITLTLNGATLSALVNEQGAWSMVIPAGSLQALPQGTSQITFVTTDAAGNSNPQPVNINVKTVDGPTMTLDPMFGNNIVSISEAASDSTLSGSASGLANGTPVVVTINGEEYTGEVNDGSWSVVIPSGSLDTSGQYTVTVTGVDAFGNPATVNGNLDVVLTRPTATVTEPLFGDDNILGQAEANAGVQLTGSTGQSGPGQTVSIILDNGQQFTGAVDNNGNWIVSLTPAQLIAITDGTHDVQISVTDRAGNTAVSDPVSVEIRTDPLPEPQLAPLFTDGILSATEAAGTQTFSGQLNLDPSRVASVTVSINNGAPLAATINADGTWSLNVDSATLQALPDGVLPVTVTVTDTADNQATGQGSFEAIINALPQANYVTPFGDFTINSAETKSDQLITGNTGVIGTGQTVSVVLGTKTYTGTVNENGDWTVTVPQADLAALSDNDSLPFSVTVSDRAGNTATTDAQQTPDVTVHTALPAPTVTNPFGDSIVNISEAAGEVTLAGLTGATGPNQYVTVKIDVDGVTYTANVDANGNWSVVLPAGTLQSLAPGAHEISIYAEDQYGNSNITPVPYQVALTPPSVTITAPVFADGYVSAAEAAAGTTLSGTFSTSYPANAQVKVTIGDRTFDATVNGTQWTLTMDADDWSTITARGQQSVTVSVTDGAQNVGTASITTTLLLDPPTVSVTAPFAGDNLLDFAESQTSQAIGGTSTGLATGDTVRVTFAGGNVFETTVQADGSWELVLTPGELAQLQAGAITVEGIDKAGNVGTASNGGTLSINLTPPTYSVNMDLVAGDNYVNATEFSSGTLRLSGQAFNLNGTTLTILNGQTTLGTATVNADGSWTLDVPRTALPDGNYTLTVQSDTQASATASQTVVVDTVAPTLAMAQFTSDDVINSSEKAVAQTISGTSDANGSQVTVTLNGKTYTALVANGTWSVDVPQSDMAALGDGSYTITATLSDAAGNATNATQEFTVDASSPLLAVDALGVPAVLNSVNAASGVVLQGQGEPGNSVTIQLGPLSWTGTVDQQGNWSHTFPQLDLTTLTDGPQVVTISSTDAAGNTSSNNLSLNVALNKGLGVAIDQVFNDGILNVAESLVTQLLTGKVSGDYRGAKVSLTVIGTDFTINDLAVAPDGSYSFSLPPSLWQGLITDTLQLQVSVVDANGNTRYETVDVGLALTDLPVVNDVVIAGDNVINLVESTVAQTLSGTVSNVANVTSVVVNFGGQAINATVDALGNWSAALPAELLSTLPDGTATANVTVTDKFGNVIKSDASFNVVSHNLPAISLDPLFGDGLLNVADSLVNQTISGAASGAPIGSTVQVAIGAKVFNGVVNADGTFAIALTPTDLAGLADGTFTPSITLLTPDGNSSTTAGSQVIIGVKNVPTVAITSLFGNDGFLNQSEALAAQTISGTVTGLTSGQVTVNVGGTAYQVPVTDGRWSLALSAGALASIADGTLSVTATVTDAVGNTATGSQLVNAIVQAVPSIGINTLFGNGTLDLNDLLSNPILSGTSSNLAAGTQITVKVGLLSYTTTVGANGQWQLAIPAVSLQNLQDGNNALQVSASATDAAGNIANVVQSASVAIQALPTVAITSLFGDGALSLADITTAQVISGTSQNAVGSQLTVTVGGKNYLTTVASNGSWSVTVPKVDLSALADGTQAVSVAVTNAAGKVANITSPLDVITHNLPTITLSSLFGNDGYLNISEAANGQVIGGKIGGVVSGSKVVVTVGGTAINATVDANGNWTATVNKTLLQGLSSGAAKVGISVTDRVGNTTATEADVQVKLTQPTLSTNPITNLTSVLGNVLLGLVGSAKLTISGASTNLNQGAIVHVNLLNLAMATAIVGADGKWSTQLDVGLDLAKILSLNTVVNLYTADVAGNLAYLNVGLNGSNPTTTPPAGTSASLMAEANTFSLLAASASEESDSTTSSDSLNAQHTATVETAHQPEKETAAAATASDESYTIGGLSIDLADGTSESGASVEGSSGNDTIHLSSLGFVQIDGGAGTDTLVLDGANLLLNLIELGSKVSNIEVIDLGKSGSNSVTLDVNEALSITDKPEDDLLIKGSIGDEINLKHGVSDTWAISGQRDVDGIQFDVYHNSSQANTLSDVLIQHGLHVNMV